MSTGHFMLPGSHERRRGAECRCGHDWDRWNDRCCSPEAAREAGRADARDLADAILLEAAPRGLGAVWASHPDTDAAIEFGPGAPPWPAVHIEWSDDGDDPGLYWRVFDADGQPAREGRGELGVGAIVVAMEEVLL